MPPCAQPKPSGQVRYSHWYQSVSPWAKTSTYQLPCSLLGKLIAQSRYNGLHYLKQKETIKIWLGFPFLCFRGRYRESRKNMDYTRWPRRDHDSDLIQIFVKCIKSSQTASHVENAFQARVLTVSFRPIAAETVNNTPSVLSGFHGQIRSI